MAELNSELSSKLNINRRLPPELLTRIFQFLPFSDLNNVLLVCSTTILLPGDQLTIQNVF